MATLSGTSSNDTLTGTDAADSITGLAGNDNLSGNGGNDTLLGGDGDDHLLGGAGDDSIDGGADGQYGDRVDYAGSTTGVDVNLTTGLATDGLGGTDTLLNIEHISGSAFADRLVGNSQNNWFNPGAGNDTVDGVASLGFSPNAVMYGDASAGVVINLATGVADGTSIGHDTLANIWAAHGSDFDDQITLSDNGGYTFGQAGNDLINGGSQGEYLYGGTGNDTINGGGGSDTAAYEFGTTQLDGLTLAGTASSGWILSRSGVNLVGFTANTATGKWTVTDLRTAAPSNGPMLGVDLLSAVEQVSIMGVDGNGGGLTVNLSLEGTFANPLLSLRQVGSGGDDLLSGTSGNDTLQGLAGNDTLFGLGGNDTLRGGPGDDTLNGGQQIYLIWRAQIATSDFDVADYSDVTLGGIRLDLSTMKVTGVNGADVGTDTLRGIELVNGTRQTDVVAGNFAALLGNNEAAGDQHGVDFYGYGGSDAVALGTVSNVPWVDFGVYYQWSRTGVTAVFSGSTGTVSYGAANGQLAGTDTIQGAMSFGGTSFNDRFDFSGMTGTALVGSKNIYITLGSGGNDTVVGGTGQTQVNLLGGANYSSTTGQGINVHLAAPGVVFTVDMTHLSKNNGAQVMGTATLSNINRIRGGNLDDTLVGGAYDDFESFRGMGGNDFIDGGTGWDRADYPSATAAVTVNLAAGTVSGDTSTGFDTLRSVEGIMGTWFNDTFDARGFSGTSVNAGSYGYANRFEGRGGNDTIYGNGNTQLDYSYSNVAIEANMATGKAYALDPANRTGELALVIGEDTFSGVYRIRGSALGDSLLGGGVGWMSGDTGIEVFDPGAGNDTVNGFGGWDWVGYGSSTAAITVDLRLATGQVQDGMGGVDTLIGIEAVGGSDFNDSMVGSDTNNTGFGNQESFRGGKGDDTLNGGGGYDEAEYTDDPTNGVVVNLATGVAKDGWGGTDTLSNIEGVVGSWKADSITGSSADNRLDGRAGNDTLDGGAGSDWAEYNQATGAVQVNLALGTATGADGNDTLVNIENVRGSVYGDTLTGNAGANTLQGLAGNDTLDGGLGKDRAVFSGKYANYTVTTSGNTTTVKDNVGTDGTDTLVNMEEMAFSDKTVSVTGGLRGIAYDWKNHMLLKDVTVTALGGGAPVDAPIQFKAGSSDASGRATLEVWSHSTKAFENAGFEIEIPKATGLTFTAGALPANAAGASGWTVLVNAEVSKLTMAGFATDTSYAVSAADFKLGTLTFEVGTAQSVDVYLVGGDVGGATAIAYGVSGARTNTSVSGEFSFTALQSGTYDLSATRATTDIGSAVTSADALAALKLAVGINPNPDPDGTGPQSALVVSPYQFMAADVTGTDGRVTSADALAILKMAVKLPTAPTKEWMFVEESRDFWNETTSKFILDRNSASWDHSISGVKVPGETNLVGVLKGDVNGSWTAPAGSPDLDTLVPTHFTALSSVFGMPVAQFGIV